MDSDIYRAGEREFRGRAPRAVLLPPAISFFLFIFFYFHLEAALGRICARAAVLCDFANASGEIRSAYKFSFFLGKSLGVILTFRNAVKRYAREKFACTDFRNFHEFEKEWISFHSLFGQDSKALQFEIFQNPHETRAAKRLIYLCSEYLWITWKTGEKSPRE